jgi:hypothetical protein
MKLPQGKSSGTLFVLAVCWEHVFTNTELASWA